MFRSLFMFRGSGAGRPGGMLNMPPEAQKAFDEANARAGVTRTASELAERETLSLEAARARVREITREP